MQNKIIYQSNDVSALYKYRVWRLFEGLTRAQRKKALEVLPNSLGVSVRTIQNWMYIQKDDNKTIPADRLFQLATFFKVSINEMWTEVPQSLFKERLTVDNL